MILLNALRGVHVRLLMGKTGSWVADVDVDLELVPVVPTGPAALTIGTNILRGTIDDDASGRFGTNAKIRLVGGAGWSQAIPPLSIDNDAGVLSTAVYAVVAASVGEPPVVELEAPKLFGAHYSIMGGAAAQVFDGVDWWVDILGITHVGPRIPLPAPPIADVLEWDPIAQVAVVASDILIVPGMTLTDIRFGIATVEDVEHTFSDDGARAVCWCSTPSLTGAATSLLAPPPATSGGKLVKALGELARRASGAQLLKTYGYRVISQGPDGRLNLQSTTPDSGAPLFLRLIDIWAGVAGVSVKVAPLTVVSVRFLEGDRDDPLAELEQDVVHLILEAYGSNPDVRTRGAGLRAALSGDAARLPETKAQIEAQLQDDPRITRATASFKATDTRGAYAIDIAIETNAGELAVQFTVDAAGRINRSTS